MATVEAVRPVTVSVEAPEYEQLFRSTVMKDFCEHFNSLDEGEYVPAPNEQSIDSAWRLFCRLNLRQLKPTRIMPSPEGGVALCFSRRTGRYADFECFNSGKTMIAMSNGYDVEVFGIDLGNDEGVDRVIFQIGEFLDSAQDALPLRAVSR
jgi:hypothetical protein